MGKKRDQKRQPEDRARNADNKLKIYASKSAIEMANNDPEVKRQIIARIYGVALPDEAEVWRRKLLATIDEQAIRKINENPDYASNIADRRIRQVMEEWGLIREGEEWPKKRPTMDDFIEQLEKISRIKEIVRAGQPGWFETLKNPENVTAILSMLNQIISMRQPPATTGEFVWVTIEGKDKLIPREQLQQFKEKWKAKPIENLELIEPDNHSKGDDTASESEIRVEAKEKDGNEGSADSDD